MVVAGRRRLRRRRRGHQTRPCSERLRGERVARPARSTGSQYARRGALASRALPFIAGATCELPATNQGRGPRAERRRAGAEARPPRTSPRGGRCRCEPVDEWRSAGVVASPGRGGAERGEGRGSRGRPGGGWSLGWASGGSGVGRGEPPGDRPETPVVIVKAAEGRAQVTCGALKLPPLRTRSLRAGSVSQRRPYFILPEVKPQSSVPAVYLGTCATTISVIKSYLCRTTDRWTR